MREILFKAKRKDNGEWIEGHYTECRGETFIGIDTSSMFEIFCPPVIRWFKVRSETLCQFTGHCDRYGNKIWEHDILKTWSDEYAQVKFGLYSTGFASDDCNQGFYVEFPEDAIYRHELGYWCKESYVIGNIFDNKELLQEETNE